MATIRGAYPQIYTFRATTPNLIVVGTWEKSKIARFVDLRAKAVALDQRFKGDVQVR